ncbi:MAG: PA14 domain-containing protein [Planctomycetaceae bacterium]
MSLLNYYKLFSILFTFLLMLANNAFAQTFPQNWEQLSASDFAYAVDPFYDPTIKGTAGDFDEEAVRQHAANLFLQFDLESMPVSDFPVVYRLYRSGWWNLNEEQTSAIRTALSSRQDVWTGRPYEESLSKVMLMDWVDVPFERMSEEVINFFDAGGQFENVWPDDLQDYARLAIRNPQVIPADDFTVQWRGEVIPPQTGQYKFLIGSVNASHTDLDYSFAESMSVSINGEEVISATPTQWTSSSGDIQLTAGQAVPIQVDLTVKSTGIPHSVLHALLFWEGPGISKTIIPTERFIVPGGGTTGLQATYTWQNQGQDESIVRVDKNLDFAWTSGEVKVAGEMTLHDQLVANAWQYQTSTSFLDSLVDENGKIRMHSWTIDPHFSAQNMTSSQRQSFLEILLSRPELLDAFSAFRMMYVYKSYRFGAEDVALDVFGTWAHRHANLEPDFPLGPFLYKSNQGVDLENREAFFHMASPVTQELPAHADRLQDEFLEMPDGSCCLPVAYTLGYSYLSRNNLTAWTELLENKLANESLTGDQRAGWLIARAHAHEIRLSTRNPFVMPHSRPLDARDLLETAILEAEDPELKFILNKHIAIRLTAAGLFDEARSILDEATNLAPVERLGEIATWKASIDKLEALQMERQTSQAATANQAYVEKLQARLVKAQARGDDVAVQRYQALISAAQGE